VAYSSSDVEANRLHGETRARKMDPKNMMPVEMGDQTKWTLSSDRKTIRLALPPLPLAGMAEPIRAVDAMLERLTILRGQMLPPLPAPNKRN
jgi:hypothetical protein